MLLVDNVFNIHFPNKGIHNLQNITAKLYMLFVPYKTDSELIKFHLDPYRLKQLNKIK